MPSCAFGRFRDLLGGYGTEDLAALAGLNRYVDLHLLQALAEGLGLLVNLFGYFFVICFFQLQIV